MYSLHIMCFFYMMLFSYIVRHCCQFFFPLPNFLTLTKSGNNPCCWIDLAWKHWEPQESVFPWDLCNHSCFFSPLASHMSLPAESSFLGDTCSLLCEKQNPHSDMLNFLGSWKMVVWLIEQRIQFGSNMAIFQFLLIRSINIQVLRLNSMFSFFQKTINLYWLSSRGNASWAMSEVGFNTVGGFHVENSLLSNYMQWENLEFISDSVSKSQSMKSAERDTQRQSEHD